MLPGFDLTDIRGTYLEDRPLGGRWLTRINTSFYEVLTRAAGRGGRVQTSEDLLVGRLSRDPGLQWGWVELSGRLHPSGPQRRLQVMFRDPDVCLMTRLVL